MKIALLGYGKMGVEIEKIALERGHEVVHKFNRSNPPEKEKIQEANIVIEFTRPESAVENLRICLEAGIPVVTGTTGWYDAIDSIRFLCEQTNGSLFTATNFSLGVNITYFVNRILAKIMADQHDYSAGITEIHHTRKLDAPSGTAISLAEGIIENNPRFNGWELAEGTAEGGTLPINPIREGDVPGTHKVLYQSGIDSITLTHEAHNRTGFALGAVLAAEWLIGKKGVYGMEDMLNFEASL